MEVVFFLLIYVVLIGLFFVYVFPFASLIGAIIASAWMVVNFFHPSLAV